MSESNLSDTPIDTKRNRAGSAFKESFNVLGLAGAAALSAALLNPLPLLIGIVVEAAYLLFVPDSKWYETRLSERFDAEVAARIGRLRVATFARIGTDRQERFDRMMEVRGIIGANEAHSRERWFRDVIRKLDYLSEKWLLFASKEAEFRAHIRDVFEESNSVSRQSLGDYPMVESIKQRFEREVSALTTLRDTESDLNTRAVLEKRIDVLEQRRAQIGRIADALGNLRQQLQLLEDSFALVNDQLRARAPDQILADVDGIVYQTDAMTKMLDVMSLF